MNYNKLKGKEFSHYENFDEFYSELLQKVRNNWNPIGNQILGLDKSKVSRIFKEQQKDADTLFRMAALMQINIMFGIIN